MTPRLFINDEHITRVLDAVAPAIRAKLIDALTPIAEDIAADAKAAAEAHIRFLGAKNPGSYVESIKAGVSTRDAQRVIGYVRSGHHLAHLLEDGFTISDLTIVPGTGKAGLSHLGAIMAFDGDAGMQFAREIHRHETKVHAFPAINPAFAARRGEILAAMERVASEAGQGID